MSRKCVFRSSVSVTVRLLRSEARVFENPRIAVQRPAVLVLTKELLLVVPFPDTSVAQHWRLRMTGTVETAVSINENTVSCHCFIYFICG